MTNLLLANDCSTCQGWGWVGQGRDRQYCPDCEYGRELKKMGVPLWNDSQRDRRGNTPIEQRLAETVGEDLPKEQDSSRIPTAGEIARKFRV